MKVIILLPALALFVANNEAFRFGGLSKGITKLGSSVARQAFKAGGNYLNNQQQNAPVTKRDIMKETVIPKTLVKPPGSPGVPKKKKHSFGLNLRGKKGKGKKGKKAAMAQAEAAGPAAGPAPMAARAYELYLRGKKGKGKKGKKAAMAQAEAAGPAAGPAPMAARAYELYLRGKKGKGKKGKKAAMAQAEAGAPAAGGPAPMAARGIDFVMQQVQKLI